MEDAFAREERKHPPAKRPPPPPPGEERTTVVCGCGTVMMLAWRTAEPVRCFGCGRTFAPPPFVTAAPLRWRPDLARPPSRRKTIAIALAIAALLLFVLGLAVGLVLARHG